MRRLYKRIPFYIDINYHSCNLAHTFPLKSAFCIILRCSPICIHYILLSIYHIELLQRILACFSKQLSKSFLDRSTNVDQACSFETRQERILIHCSIEIFFVYLDCLLGFFNVFSTFISLTLSKPFIPISLLRQRIIRYLLFKIGFNVFRTWITLW